MKSHNLIKGLVIILTIVLLTGCSEKRTELKFEGDEGTVVFNVKDRSGYKISTNKDDFRTSKEQAVLIGNGFKIGIEFDDGFSYFYDGDFNKLKEEKKNSPDYLEVTYGSFSGIQYFYNNYNRYNVVLLVKNSNKYMLNLYVYGAFDEESSAKTAIKNAEVLDILNNIKTISTVK